MNALAELTGIRAKLEVWELIVTVALDVLDCLPSSVHVRVDLLSVTGPILPKCQVRSLDCVPNHPPDLSVHFLALLCLLVFDHIVDLCQPPRDVQLNGVTQCP